MTEASTKIHHSLKKTPVAPRRVQVPQWPSYTGTSQPVGTSPNGRVAVYVDPTLGQQGLQNARDLLADADRIVAANNSFFGTPSGATNVILFAMPGPDGNPATDGTGGADHMACNFIDGQNIEVCVSFGNSMRCSALFEAELSECSMGGNLCGVSTGEALSRWCAAEISNNAMSDFATAPTWADGGMRDYVNQTDPTDRNPESTGCGMAFLSWLMSQGNQLNMIAPAMVSLGDSGTLAQLYASLTGDDPSNAWPNFMAAVQSLPEITSDDPFGGPAQMAQLTPSTIELAAKVFSSILADLAAGRPAQHTVATVRTMLSTPTGRQFSTSAICSTGSHRLALPGSNLRSTGRG